MTRLLRKVDGATGEDILEPLSDDDVDGHCGCPCLVASYSETGVNLILPGSGLWTKLTATYAGEPDICNPAITSTSPWTLTAPVDGYLDLDVEVAGTLPGGWTTANLDVGLFRDGAFYKRIGRRKAYTGDPDFDTSGAGLIKLLAGSQCTVGISYPGVGVQSLTSCDIRIDIHFVGELRCGGCPT